MAIMCQTKKVKRTMINKALHIKLKNEQHEPHKILEWTLVLLKFCPIWWHPLCRIVRILRYFEVNSLVFDCNSNIWLQTFKNIFKLAFFFHRSWIRYGDCVMADWFVLQCRHMSRTVLSVRIIHVCTAMDIVR